jgi:hypothetical protein
MSLNSVNSQGKIVGDEDKVVKAGLEVVFQPVADLIQKIAGPAAEEFGLTLKDHVLFLRLKRQARLWQRVKEFLYEAGIDPQRVPLKLLGPIIESGSLEEDDLLQDKWAALLANAANGHEDAVHPSFVEVLKQISALEAHFLDALYSLRLHKGPRGEGKLGDDQVITAMFTDLKNELSTKTQRAKVADMRIKFDEAGLNLNLDRLGLVKAERLGAEVFWYEMTRFGTRFVAACQSPKKENKASHG